MPFENLIINAAAGAGKTTRIVQEAIAHPENRILITTYTNNNEAEIRKKFIEIYGYVPRHVKIQTWFTFLLEHFVRPYQNVLFAEQRVQGLAFVNRRSAQGVPEADTRRHYFARGNDLNIYSDKISKFGIKCENFSRGLVTGRLAQIYDHIYVDEVQDLAGWDLDILQSLFDAEIRITLVGDYRQSTFATNRAARHSQFAGVRIIDKFRAWEITGACVIEDLAISHRCNQDLCNFSDRFFPEAPRTTSRNTDETEHDGVFVVSTDDVPEYVRRYSPQVLRNDRRTNCAGLPAMNFGESKGLGFDRVLIFPHGPLRNLLNSGDFDAYDAPTKPYVAVTRARQSVAFVFDGEPVIPGVRTFSF